MDYQYYKEEYEGSISEAEYARLYPKVRNVLKMYVDDIVRTDQLKQKLDDYGNFDKAICLELDYLDQNGGVAAINGSSDLDLKQFESSGYKFQVGTGGHAYKGIPLSPMAESIIMTELKKNGYLRMGWNW